MTWGFMAFLWGCYVLAGGPSEDDLTTKARQFLEAMQAGDFDRAARDFDETMLRVSGPEKLAAFWKGPAAEWGALKRQTRARRETLGGYDIVLVTCEFAKVTLDARVVFDRAGRIAGFGFQPSLPPAVYKPPAYADPSKFTETPVTVGRGEWSLPGTMTIPKGPGPFPAVVLVHGSGPNDRDESLGANRPFKDLAWGLASRGIAVLRYDKRSKVHGARIVADPRFEAGMTVKDETIDDALAAVTLAQATPRIAKTRVFVLGHSLGGFLMPRMAQAARDLGVSGYISMAGLTRPLEDTIVRQMDYIYSLAGGALSDDDRKKLADIKAAVAKVKDLTGADRGSTTKLLGAMPTYWLDLRGYDPPSLARSVSQPMLILQGGRDYQVTTDDFARWKAALGTRKDVVFHLYPKLNHLFFEGQGMATPAEYLQLHGSVAPYVVSDIARWVKGAPLARRSPSRTVPPPTTKK